MAPSFFRSLACWVVAAGLLAACTDDPAPAATDTYTVRGLYLGTAFDSAAAVVSHEAIPGFMDAMRMQLRVRDRTELRGLRAGDKIRFILADDGSGFAMRAVDKLPPDTPLDLADTLDLTDTLDAADTLDATPE